MKPLQRFIRTLLYHKTSSMNYVNPTLIPCGRQPCYCILQKDLHKNDTEYVQCYQTWKIWYKSYYNTNG